MIRKSNLLKYDIIGIIFTIIIGSLLHFAYDSSGNNRLIGLFTPINESVWEHLKLLFFPMLLYSIFEYFVVGNHYPSYVFAKTIGIICGLITIPTLFYIYTAISGKPILAIDISIFIISCILAFTISFIICTKFFAINPIFNSISLLILGIIIIIFFEFTYAPPNAKIFISPS